MNQLGIPDDAIEHDDATEVLRGWVVGGDLQLSLRFDVFGDDVETWGQLLAETVHHLADSLSAAGGVNRDAVFARIQSGLLDNLAHPFPGLHGTVQGPAQ